MTGEPYAGEPHVRFGGREGESLPYPYHPPGRTSWTPAFAGMTKQAGFKREGADHASSLRDGRGLTRRGSLDPGGEGLDPLARLRRNGQRLQVRIDPERVGQTFADVEIEMG